MDLVTFESFLESQETALGAILKSGTDIEPNDVRKAVERHAARTNRIVRNALPPIPNPAHESPTPPTRSQKRTLRKSKTTPSSNNSTPTGGPLKTPLTRRIVYGGATRLFSSSKIGSGEKRVYISSDTDSDAGSLPENSNTSSMKTRAKARKFGTEPSSRLFSSPRHVPQSRPKRRKRSRRLKILLKVTVSWIWRIGMSSAPTEDQVAGRLGDDSLHGRTFQVRTKSAPLECRFT
jgi:hypothetical protein